MDITSRRNQSNKYIYKYILQSTISHFYYEFHLYDIFPNVTVSPHFSALLLPLVSNVSVKFPNLATETKWFE